MGQQNLLSIRYSTRSNHAVVEQVKQLQNKMFNFSQNFTQITHVLRVLIGNLEGRGGGSRDSTAPWWLSNQAAFEFCNSDCGLDGPTRASSCLNRYYLFITLSEIP